jgi:hypothetical protein
MNFKQYLAEFHNIEAGQAFEKHETPTDGSISISNPKVRAEINYRLDGELDDIFLSPESGIQRVRKVLHRFSLDMPALYDADAEGDEIVIRLDQFGHVIDFTNLIPNKVEEIFYLYLIYYLTDDGRYEFYAELTDEEGLNEIMSDEEEDEEEE